MASTLSIPGYAADTTVQIHAKKKPHPSGLFIGAVITSRLHRLDQQTAYMRQMQQCPADRTSSFKRLSGTDRMQPASPFFQVSQNLYGLPSGNSDHVPYR